MKNLLTILIKSYNLKYGIYVGFKYLLILEFFD